MGYIVIDNKTGLEITNVQVIKDTQDSVAYCRNKANKMFNQAEQFYNTEIQPK